MEEDVVVVINAISISVGIWDLNADQGVIQAVGTAPLGIMYIEVTDNDGSQ
jgi:hypothetical protein